MQAAMMGSLFHRNDSIALTFRSLAFGVGAEEAHEVHEFARKRITRFIASSAVYISNDCERCEAKKRAEMKMRGARREGDGVAFDDVFDLSVVNKRR